MTTRQLDIATLCAIMEIKIQKHTKECPLLENVKQLGIS